MPNESKHSRPRRKITQTTADQCSSLSCRIEKPCDKAKKKKIDSDALENATSNEVVEDFNDPSPDQTYQRVGQKSCVEEAEQNDEYNPEEEDDTSDEEVALLSKSLTRHAGRRDSPPPRLGGAQRKPYEERKSDRIVAEASMWILTRIVQVENKYSYCTADDLHLIYANDCIEKKKEILGKVPFNRMVLRYFPSLFLRYMTHPDEKGGQSRKLYLGIKILSPVMEAEGDFNLTSVMVPQDLSVTLHTERVLQVRYITTNYSVNGNPLVYTLTVTKDGDVKLSFMGKEVQPLSIGFPDKIRMINSDLQAVFKCLRAIVLCTGISLDGWKEVDIPNKDCTSHFVEKWTKPAQGLSSSVGWYIRSRQCSAALPIWSVYLDKCCVSCKNLKSYYISRGRFVADRDHGQVVKESN
ncbi:uncharacterized protein LOC135489661 [Lineus longissimus]|uniref:uncharacterized protein LOC135489661 n=1 Tax=Lineus longissimus TaxID=88925 RepID=UPI00315D108D